MYQSFLKKKKTLEIYIRKKIKALYRSFIYDNKFNVQ